VARSLLQVASELHAILDVKSWLLVFETM
jgi:regulator of replication initiation timing